MKRLRRVLRRLSGLSSHERSEREIAAELEAHLAMAMEDRVRAGLPPIEARRRALMELGGVEQTKQAYREGSTLPWLENLGRDVRFALRQLRKNKGFTVTAITMLALGMCASVAIFAFVDAALVKPLPYARPGELASLFESNQTGPRFHLSYPDYLDWKRTNHVFRSLDIYTQQDLLLSTPEGAQQVNGAHVSDGFFRTLGVQPVLGRAFQDGDERRAASSTVVLSYAAWQKRFGGRQDVLGQTVTLNGVPASVIGVLPKQFHFAPTEPAEFWLTISATERCAKNRNCHDFYGVGRLKDGVSVAAADVEMRTIAQELQRQYPETNRNRGATVISLTEMIVGDVRPILLVLLCGAGLLLSIASVNVSSLLLVRSESRKREIALRGALGASSARLVCQFVTEGLLLAGAGCVLGVTAAYAAMHGLARLIPAEMMVSMPYLQEVGMNARVAGFALLVAVGAGLTFSLTPLLRLSFQDVREGLSGGGRNAAGTVWRRFGANLVVVELAIAMVLLVGAGLLGQSFYRLLQVDTGLHAENLAMLALWGDSTAYAKDEQMAGLERKVLERLAVLPGVRSVALSSDLPVGSGDGLTTMGIVGKPMLGNDNEVNDRDVSIGYFSTLQARLLQGRYFAETDDAQHPRVAIVNRTLAQQYFAGEDVPGKRILFGGTKDKFEIVGVVDDIKEGPLDMATHPVVYTSLTQTPGNSFYVIARTAERPQSLLPVMAAAVRQIDPKIATYKAMTMVDHIHDSPSEYLHRSSAWLVGGFAGMALLLGVVGLYGVVAYSVSQRTREIGVRMALGAQRGTVYGLVLREAAWLAAAGIGIGLMCSVGAATLMSNLLFATKAWDVPTLAGVAVVLGVSAVAASFVPARRAALIDPIEALRAE